MKCRNQRIARTRRPEKIADAKLHLIGRFVGECDGEDLLRPDVAIFNQVRHAISDDPRLPAPRARENQDRALGGLNSFELFGIEKFREIHAFLLATKRHKTHKAFVNYVPLCGYSTVTLLARFRGWSISQPRRTATRSEERRV